MNKLGYKMVVNLSKLLLLFSISMSALGQVQIDRQQRQLIVTELAGTTPANFSAFLSDVAALLDNRDEDFTILLQGYRDGAQLSVAQSNALYSLLGLYARVKYADDAMQTLRELVAIPTFNVESLPQYANPEFQRFAVRLESLAEDFGLMFRNVDGRVYEISLGAPQGELIGVHAHADVVPVNPDLWVLEDGTKLAPFVMTQIDGRMYGRGTEDDKNGIVVSMYAMRIVQDEKLPLLRHFKLLVDTREETGGDAMPYYFARNPIPDYNIALDGSYPVVIAEKGFGTVMATFPFRAAVGEGAEIVELSGGLATNQIPASSSAWLQTNNPAALVTRLNEAGAIFAARGGSDFVINASRDGARVRLDVLGVSAHSSDPSSGINPVSRMFAFIDELAKDGILQSNHFTDAALYATMNWGVDYLGEKLGIAYSDPFMGPLTAAQTFVAVDDAQLRTAVNLRLPVGREPQAVVQQLEDALAAWASDSAVAVHFAISAREPMYRNPEGEWVNALLDIAVENLDIPRQFASSSGATSIHNLPNGVQFGLAMATEKYTGHNANEFKTVEQFLLDLQIVTEMFARLGTMPKM